MSSGGISANDTTLTYVHFTVINKWSVKAAGKRKQKQHTWILQAIHVALRMSPEKKMSGHHWWIYGSSWCEHYITTTTKIVNQLHCMRSQEITKDISSQHLRKSAKFPKHLIMIIINSCSENDLVVELFNCLWQRWIETCRFSQKTPQSFPFSVSNLKLLLATWP